MVKYFYMGSNNRPSLGQESGVLSFVKEELADFLTLSRAIIGLVILSLSFVGRDAYLAVVILTLCGGVTDIFDGKAARRYLGEDREGKLGKHDLEIDTFFVLCVLCYLSLSEIVIPKIVGLAWIGLVVIAAILYKRKPKVLLLFEVPTALALLAVAGLYDVQIFALVIMPAVLLGVIINYKRVLYIVFEYWPKLFFK